MRCNKNGDCNGGKLCIRGFCAFRYLSLAHADESVNYSDSPSDQVFLTDVDVDVDFEASQSLIGLPNKCSTNKDCTGGKLCIRGYCALRTLMMALFD